MMIIDDWDPTGCDTVYDSINNPDEVRCLCTHLTNFACLVVSKNNNINNSK